MRWSVSLVVVCGCASAYRSGELRAVDAHARTYGCLDVSATLVHDGAVSSDTPVVEYRFGDGCDRAVVVDLSAVQVTASYASGWKGALAPFDPDGALRPLGLDPRTRGQEAVSYQPPEGVTGPPLEVCVDLSRITDAAAGDAPLCLSTGAEAVARIDGEVIR